MRCLGLPRQAFPQSGLVIDRLPPPLHEQLERACLVVRGAPGIELVPMPPEELQRQLGIRGIIFVPTGRKGFAKLGQGPWTDRIQHQKVILQQGIGQTAFGLLQTHRNLSPGKLLGESSGPCLDRFRRVADGPLPICLIARG
jgi:hypothetical protein